MTSTLEEKITLAQKRLDQLRQQRRRKEAAARSAASKKERADDTRRKILAGAVALSDPGLCNAVLAELARRLDRPDDRALFGFLGHQQGGNHGDAGGDASGWPSQPTDQNASGGEQGNQDAGTVV